MNKIKQLVLNAIGTFVFAFIIATAGFAVGYLLSGTWI